MSAGGPSRDIIGYGATPPDARWPNGARVAVNFCLNYEEGAERHVDHGDRVSESILADVMAPPRPGGRNPAMESQYDFGARAGFWRILECFQERGLDFTVNAVGQALTLNPAAPEAIARSGADLHAHGWRWIDYADVPEDMEREHIRLTVETIRDLTGSRPVGWYTGRPSLNTRRLAVEEGGFLYDSDVYNDDLPYWTHDYARPHLVIPYSLDTNDSRLNSQTKCNTGIFRSCNGKAVQSARS